MDAPRHDLPFTEFRPEQAVAFSHRWDRLRAIILQRNVLTERRVFLTKEFEKSKENFTRRVRKLVYLFLFINMLMLLKKFSDGAVWYQPNSENFLFFVASALISAILFQVVALDNPALLEGKIDEMTVELERLSADFLATSGGLGWSPYISEDPLGFHAPDEDRDFMKLKTSIAERCLWNGDFQRNPETRVVMWVRG